MPHANWNLFIILIFFFFFLELGLSGELQLTAIGIGFTNRNISSEVNLAFLRAFEPFQNRNPHDGLEGGLASSDQNRLQVLKGVRASSEPIPAC